MQQLLERSPDPILWAGEITAWLDGTRGSDPLSLDQLADAVRDFLANGEEFAIRLFRGYLRKAGEPQSPAKNGTRPGRTPRPNAGAQGYANAIAALEDLNSGDTP